MRLLARIGADPRDDHEVRLQKALLVGITLMIIPAAIVWGLIYAAFGEWLAAAIPLSYSVVSALSLFIFALTRRYHVYRFSQLLLILLLPFFLMAALGGFINSGAVILWSLLCPLGALLFADTRQAARWLLAYLGLVLLSGFLQTSVRSANNLPSVLVLIFFVMNIGTISAITFILLFYFVGQKNSALDLLRIEQQRSENLLLNVLPEEIAAILKNGNRTSADHFDAVSILFADLVGFTPLSAQLSPKEMVDLLNEIFLHFDALAEKYNVEKIRTIGDNYMVAAGVPRPRPDHAQALARMALDMCDYISHRPPHGDRHIDFRIGINSGPVVAGVIGRKKFQYDLWGDAVNTASRMESHGIGGRIQITQETYELLKDEFICELRGTVMVKGKGEMETWYLLGVKALSELDADSVT